MFLIRGSIQLIITIQTPSCEVYFNYFFLNFFSDQIKNQTFPAETRKPTKEKQRYSLKPNFFLKYKQKVKKKIKKHQTHPLSLYKMLLLILESSTEGSSVSKSNKSKAPSRRSPRIPSNVSLHNSTVLAEVVPQQPFGDGAGNSPNEQLDLLRHGHSKSPTPTKPLTLTLGKTTIYSSNPFLNS